MSTFARAIAIVGPLPRWCGVALLLAAIVLTTNRSLAASDEPIELDAILSLTGTAALLGKAEGTALTIAADVVNRRGGIRGRQIRLVALDDQSNPQIAVALANQVLAKSRYFMGPSLTAPCAAIAPLIAGAGVSYCMSPGVNPPRGSFMFSAGCGIDDQLTALIRYFRLRGWNRIALITTIDASGQAVDHGAAVALALPENNVVQFVAHEHFANADLSVAAQMARIKAAGPQVIIAWATGSPFGTLLHGIADAGIKLPIGAGSANLVAAQLVGYGALMPPDTFFPGAALLSPSSVLPGPIHDAQAVFLKAYANAHEKPEYLSTQAWDPAMIMFDALRSAGPDASPDALRAHIAGLHSWVGINGVYDFRDGSQRGLGQQNVVVDRWNAGKAAFTAASRPGGYLR